LNSNNRFRNFQIVVCVFNEKMKESCPVFKKTTDEKWEERRVRIKTSG
jgi:hypothetical protein